VYRSPRRHFAAGVRGLGLARKISDPHLTRYEHIAHTLASAGLTEQDAPPEIAREIAAEQVRLLYRQIPSALFAAVLVSVAVTAALWDVAPHATLIGWLVLTSVVSLARYGLLLAFRERRPGLDEMDAWGRRFVVLTVCAGAAWGLGAALLAAEPGFHQAFIGFVLAGIGAGAVSTLSSYPRAYSAFILPAVLPFAIAMLLTGEWIPFAMGAMALLFVSMMMVVAGRVGASIEQSLKLRFRNLGLLDDLSSTNARLSQVNDALETEVAQRRAAQNVLRKSETKLRLHALQAPLAFIEWDLNFRVVEWNPAAERIFGWTRDQALGRRASRLIAGERSCEHVAAMWQRLLKEKQGARIMLDNRTREGRDITCEWYYTPLVDEHGRVMSIIALAQDITANKLAEEKLNYIAYHDELTGLPNRALFNDRLAKAIGEARRRANSVGVMLLDVDNFKVVNDTMGHDVGDALLKDVAARLHACARETDTIARFGGDEFAIVLEDLPDPSKAFTVAQKILDAFIPPFLVNGAEVFLASSIGITFYPSDGENLDGLLKNADSAMYHAKAQGRNNYQFYSADLTERAHARLAMETSLRRALERDEFSLHYQPKVELRTGRVTGVEALLRWQDRDRGPVGPNEFIPIAEESGLILPIGDWALRAACTELKRWHDEGLTGLRLAVNLSSRQFRHKRLVNNIARIIEETGFDARCLEFEITESVLMGVDAQVSEVLAGIKEMGISISIDDFGTGYSSLSYLKRFPIDTLKIDRSFVRDIPADLDDVAIVRAIIAMARSLRMRTVAEGVEQEEQMRFLRAEGCEEMQGFLYSRPLPGDEVLRLLKMKAQIAFL